MLITLPPGGGLTCQTDRTKRCTRTGEDVVDVRFIAQPFACGQYLRDFLWSAAQETEFATLRASVTWGTYGIIEAIM